MLCDSFCCFYVVVDVFIGLSCISCIFSNCAETVSYVSASGSSDRRSVGWETQLVVELQLSWQVLHMFLYWNWSEVVGLLAQCPMYMPAVSFWVASCDGFCPFWQPSFLCSCNSVAIIVLLSINKHLLLSRFLEHSVFVFLHCAHVYVCLFFLI